MRNNQGAILVGLALMLAGVIFLIGNIFNLNVWAYCFPLGLILLGVFLLMRPRMVGPDTNSQVMLIGELERSGVYEVKDEEFWSFIGDVNYDLTKADVPYGETTIRGFGFIGDVSIYAPADMGLAVDAASFVTSLKTDDGGKDDHFLTPVHWQSDNYKMAERKVRFDLTHFIGDIKLRRF